MAKLAARLQIFQSEVAQGLHRANCFGALCQDTAFDSHPQGQTGFPILTQQGGCTRLGTIKLQSAMAVIINRTIGLD